MSVKPEGSLVQDHGMKGTEIQSSPCSWQPRHRRPDSTTSTWKT
ncbi:hypothetical protein ACP4OV_022093 [Aristida adscensionis]